MARLTPAQEQLRASQRAVKSLNGPKYHNRKVEYAGMLFDSVKEAARFDELLLMQAGGSISKLECQVPFRFEINGVKIADYYADFIYFEQSGGALIVEDVKSDGTRTAVYRLKRRMMKAFHNIDILET